MSKLYKNPRRAMVFGVCAGIADYFGFDVTVTRVLAVIAAFFSFPLIVLAYLAFAVLLPRAPADVELMMADPVQRRARSNPHDMLGSVRHRFRELDVRLQRLEKYVTSKRFKLDREFRQLKD